MEWYDTRQKLIQSAKGTKFPATMLPAHLDGPLSLTRTKKPTGKKRLKKFHLALTTRITVGCGMDATKCDVITTEEVIPLHATTVATPTILDSRVCARCFKFFYWDAADKRFISEKEDEAIEANGTKLNEASSSDSAASVSGSSLQSNDSASESEALRPNPVT